MSLDLVLTRAVWLRVSAAVARSRKHRWRGVRFLCYHSVAEGDRLPALERDTWVIRRFEFEQHLALLEKLAYQVVSLQRALELLQRGEAGNRQVICFTFDDGRCDNAEIAWPLLARYGYPAHFFVSTALLGKPGFMSSDTVRRMAAEGASFGSHAHTHRDLTLLDRVELHDELRRSRNILEELIGTSVQTVAYPYARYNAAVLKAAEQCGYRAGFGINTGVVTRWPKGLGRLCLLRNVVRNHHQAGENPLILQGGYDFLPSYSQMKDRLQQWLMRG